MEDTTFFPRSEKIIYKLSSPGDRREHEEETHYMLMHCMRVIINYNPKILAAAGFNNIQEIEDILGDAVKTHDKGKSVIGPHLVINTGISKEERNYYKLAHVLQGAILLDSEYSSRNLNELNEAYYIVSLAIRLFHHYIIPNADGITYPNLSQIPPLQNLQRHIEPIHRYIVGVSLSKSNEDLEALAEYSSLHGEQLYFLAGLSTVILNLVDQIEARTSSRPYRDRPESLVDVQYDLLNKIILYGMPDIFKTMIFSIQDSRTDGGSSHS